MYVMRLSLGSLSVFGGSPKSTTISGSPLASNLHKSRPKHLVTSWAAKYRVAGVGVGRGVDVWVTDIEADGLSDRLADGLVLAATWVLVGVHEAVGVTDCVTLQLALPDEVAPAELAEAVGVSDALADGVALATTCVVVGVQDAVGMADCVTLALLDQVASAVTDADALSDALADGPVFASACVLDGVSDAVGVADCVTLKLALLVALASAALDEAEGEGLLSTVGSAVGAGDTAPAPCTAIRPCIRNGASCALLASVGGSVVRTSVVFCSEMSNRSSNEPADSNVHPRVFILSEAFINGILKLMRAWYSSRISVVKHAPAALSPSTPTSKPISTYQ
jgi:hypothetical protein